MKIHAYFIGWRDLYHLPFVARHYGSFCERLVLYDQNSTDGSKELAISLGFEVRNYGDNEEYDEFKRLEIKNNCWKETRNLGVDYVIVADTDEFLVPPLGMTASLPRVMGLNMISYDLPIQEIFEISRGTPSEGYSKQVIFCPVRVEEINFQPGAHVCKPSGDLSREGSPAVLYHYKQIGGPQREIDRHALYRTVRGEVAKEKGFGNHYLIPDPVLREYWEEAERISPRLWREPTI